MAIRRNLRLITGCANIETPISLHQKTIMKISLTLAAMVLAISLQAQVTTTNVFQQNVNALIADANPVGLTSTNIVSGVVGEIQSIEVSLDITGGFNGDLYAYLAYGNGFAVLLNRVGRTGSDYFGYGDAGFSITLSDSATTDIHLYGGNSGSQLAGIWQPDGRDMDPQLVTDADLRAAMLGSFSGMNPNGTWTLFVADMASGYTSTLDNWSLTRMAVS
jgi:subtilisin-like proprotein convertase family protein